VHGPRKPPWLDLGTIVFSIFSFAWEGYVSGASGRTLLLLFPGVKSISLRLYSRPPVSPPVFWSASLISPDHYGLEGVQELGVGSAQPDSLLFFFVSLSVLGKVSRSRWAPLFPATADTVAPPSFSFPEGQSVSHKNLSLLPPLF